MMRLKSRRAPVYIDTAVTPAKGPYPPIARRNLIYHVYPSPANDLWRRNVDELAARWDAFNGRKVVAVATGPGLESPATVREYFPGPIEVLEVANDPQLREVASFLPLLEAVASTRDDEATFYGHTKGNSQRQYQEAIRIWREGSYRALLDGPAAMAALEKYPLAGCCKICWPTTVLPPYPSQLARGNWMFAGTYYWYRHDFAYRHPRWRDVPLDRYGAEAWPSCLTYAAYGRSLWQPWREDVYPTPSPYQVATWRRIQAPAAARPVVKVRG